MQKYLYLEENFQSIFAWSDENTFGETITDLNQLSFQNRKIKVKFLYVST